MSKNDRSDTYFETKYDVAFPSPQTLTWWARLVTLPAPDDRATVDLYAALNPWQLKMPGPSPVWDRYIVSPCSLRDIKGAAPATKHFPKATHEIQVWAVNPDYCEVKWAHGGYEVMRPMNYVIQVQLPIDRACDWLASRIAEAFIMGQILIEPDGFRGARQQFEERVREWERQARSIFNSRP